MSVSHKHMTLHSICISAHSLMPHMTLGLIMLLQLCVQPFVLLALSLVGSLVLTPSNQLYCSITIYFLCLWVVQHWHTAHLEMAAEREG